MKLLTIREKPDKMNSLRSKVMMINKETLTQERVKYCDFKSSPDIFEGSASLSDCISGGVLGGKMGLALKKEAFTTKN